MLKWNDCLSEVAFTHTDAETGVTRAIASERLNRFLDAGTQNELAAIGVVHALIPVDVKIVTMFQRDRGLERHRLERITRKDLQKFPITILEWPNGTHLVVDGHHRYVRAYAFTHEHIRARMVPASVWSPYEIDMAEIVKGVDPSIIERHHRASFSGIV